MTEIREKHKQKRHFLAKISKVVITLVVNAIREPADHG